MSDTDIVGEGPDYEALRKEARKLVPLFAPAGIQNYQSSWGIGLDGTAQPDGDKHVVWFMTEAGNWTKKSLGRETRRDLLDLRSTAITLLVYCEAHAEATA